MSITQDVVLNKVPNSLKREYEGYLRTLESVPSDALALVLYSREVELEKIRGYYYEFDQTGVVNG